MGEQNLQESLVQLTPIEKPHVKMRMEDLVSNVER